ncbi:MAG: hypothetical protein GX352_02125, partial [Clostridiales bacterium]|nr:hypothetical protein [Clostridiales bacterium]
MQLAIIRGNKKFFKIGIVIGIITILVAAGFITLGRVNRLVVIEAGSPTPDITDFLKSHI